MILRLVKNVQSLQKQNNKKSFFITETDKCMSNKDANPHTTNKLNTYPII